MMERNGLSGRMYSNVGTGGILGLELPLNPPLTQSQNHLQKHPQIVPFIQQQQQHQQQQQQQHQQQQQQQQQHQVEQQTQLSMKQPNFSYNTNSNTNPPQKPKIQMTQLTNSDEDEPGCSNDHESNSFDGNRKSGNSNGNSMSPWHRMKWTDNMVRLLIMAVYYIGDEVAGSELGSDKKKAGSGGGGAGGLLQKKGKWKSVSKAMMEKGFYVSPQQCEDKFNDLNKRYKRVNDILGKGTACKVVENQNLLESMDISPKRKEEVKKLLNSKHLFFKEMCAYHNSCNHGSGGSTGDPMSAPNQIVDIQPDPSLSQQHHLQVMPVVPQQQSCLHSVQMQHSNMLHSNSHKVGFGTSEEHDDDDEEEEDDDEDEYNDEEEEHEERRAMKKARTMVTNSAPPACQALQQLNGELMGVLQDSSKSPWEKKQWVIRQLVELEEQGVKFQFQALELEKQKLKWLKFSGEKEREMERMKIDNEKKRLENETMMLLLKKQELELLQHHSNHNSHNTY